MMRAIKFILVLALVQAVAGRDQQGLRATAATRGVVKCAGNLKDGAKCGGQVLTDAETPKAVTKTDKSPSFTLPDKYKKAGMCGKATGETIEDIVMGGATNVACTFTPNPVANPVANL